jgi:hypothetical protein
MKDLTNMGNFCFVKGQGYVTMLLRNSYILQIPWELCKALLSFAMINM